MRSKSSGKPLISVITVVYNGRSVLEKTMQSVIGQDYPDMEYIIIDGESTDGSVDIIKKYASGVDRWISEADRGIYDAMNKGVSLASGQWINFMNAGDRFHDSSVISSVFGDPLARQSDLVYSDCEYIYNDGFSIIKKTCPLDTLWKHMAFCHQALFVRTSLLKENPFNRENLAADHEFIYRCMLEGRKFHKSGTIIASYSSGGESERNGGRIVRCRWKAVRRLTPSLFMDVCYLFIYLKQKLRGFIRKILPLSVSERIIRVLHSGEQS